MQEKLQVLENLARKQGGYPNRMRVPVYTVSAETARGPWVKQAAIDFCANRGMRAPAVSEVGPVVPYDNYMPSTKANATPASVQCSIDEYMRVGYANDKSIKQAKEEGIPSTIGYVVEVVVDGD